MLTIIITSIIGMIISIIIGAIWHSPNTWGGRLHMIYIGFSDLSKSEQKEMIEKAQPEMWKTYLGQAILSLLTSIFISIVMYFTVDAGANKYFVFIYVTMIWISFIIPDIGGKLLWNGHCKIKLKRGFLIKKFLADIIYQLLTLLIITAVFTLFY